MQITSPFHQTEKSWLFERLFDLLRFILYYFCESMILSCEFTLLKEKIQRNHTFTTTAIQICVSISLFHTGVFKHRR